MRKVNSVSLQSITILNFVRIGAYEEEIMNAI